MKYDNYYTGSDVFLYFESKQNTNQVHLDKMYGFGYRDNISSMPIYGLGKSEFAFVSKGNVLCSFSIDINMLHENYLTQAIHFAAGNIKNITPDISEAKISFNDLNKRSIAQLNSTNGIISDNSGKILSTRRIYPALLHELPRYFTTRIIFNNSKALQVDEHSSGFIIEDCVLLSREVDVGIDKDGQIINRYTFIGKYRTL